jgi:hypothetical protein
MHRPSLISYCSTKDAPAVDTDIFSNAGYNFNIEMPELAMIAPSFMAANAVHPTQFLSPVTVTNTIANTAAASIGIT